LKKKRKKFSKINVTQNKVRTLSYRTSLKIRMRTLISYTPKDAYDNIVRMMRTLRMLRACRLIGDQHLERINDRQHIILPGTIIRPKLSITK
jgi:hypothetical protein